MHGLYAHPGRDISLLHICNTAYTSSAAIPKNRMPKLPSLRDFMIGDFHVISHEVLNHTRYHVPGI